MTLNQVHIIKRKVIAGEAYSKQTETKTQTGSNLEAKGKQVANKKKT